MTQPTRTCGISHGCTEEAAEDLAITERDNEFVLTRAPAVVPRDEVQVPMAGEEATMRKLVMTHGAPLA